MVLYNCKHHSDFAKHGMAVIRIKDGIPKRGPDLSLKGDP